MAIPSDLVEGGTKGKALSLLHAWKDLLDPDSSKETRTKRTIPTRSGPMKKVRQVQKRSQKSSKMEMLQKSFPEKVGRYFRGAHERCH